ncbi:hypothetical protein [Niabella aquatica]
MTSRYKILCSVQVLNEYFQDGFCPDLDIIPSEPTRAILKNARLQYKMFGHQLIIFTETEASGLPVAPVNLSGSLIFYINLKNPAFLNYTSINLEALQSRRFYFTNLYQNGADANLNLSRAISTYDNAAVYDPGDFASTASGDVFECIRSTTGNDTATGFWAARGKNQFVSETDMINRSGQILNYKAPVPAADFRVSVWGVDQSSGIYNKVLKTQRMKFESDVDQVQVDLRGIPPGKYLVKINEGAFLVWIDEAFIGSGHIGVLELFSHLDSSSLFSFYKPAPEYDNAISYTPGQLVAAGNKMYQCIAAISGTPPPDMEFWKERAEPGLLRQVHYTLHFANRTAYWKYISSLKKIDDIRVKDAHDPVVLPFKPYPASGPKEYFVSEQPIFIKQKDETSIFELLLSAPLNGITPVAPQPDFTRPGTLSRENGSYYCNMYLNY